MTNIIIYIEDLEEGQKFHFVNWQPDFIYKLLSFDDKNQKAEIVQLLPDGTPFKETTSCHFGSKVDVLD